MSKRDIAYFKMFEAYICNEKAYWDWVEQRKLFNQRNSTRYYYKKGVNRERRLKLAQDVLRDFPRAAFREVAEQIGGSREIIWEFGLWETQHDPYWSEGCTWNIFDRLRKFPDEIYEAIEETYEWSKKINVRTTEIEERLPGILEDIGAKKV